MAQLLVVEDDADILHLVWTQMRARGHQVLGASSGLEALAAVELWGPPQVAVLDVAMPAMDGLELLQQLRAATGMQELPAIFLIRTRRPRDRRGRAPAGRRLPRQALHGRDPVRRHRGGTHQGLPGTPGGRRRS